ncbi:MAG: hypothetical protein OXT09_01225 [Myxococcales bacterium]|nr:hypothetical protein [Myxococcales bacterium]
MKVPQDARFRLQRSRYALRFTCEHCALFDTERETCAHGFPTDEHRASYYESEEVPVVFCKDFELE